MGGPTWNFGGGLTYPCHGTGRKYRKWLCCEISQLNPDLRRVWPFGGIFCLTFFREGCSPAAPLDEPPLVHTLNLVKNIRFQTENATIKRLFKKCTTLIMVNRFAPKKNNENVVEQCSSIFSSSRCLWYTFAFVMEPHLTKIFKTRIACKKIKYFIIR